MHAPIGLSRRRRRPHGFTLMQTMVCLAILAILVVIALPSWNDAILGTRAAAAEAAFSRSVTDAIANAGVTGSDVVICPSSAGDCASTWDWSGGWIAFGDRDADRRHDPGERLVDVEGALGSGIRLTSTAGRRKVVVQPNTATFGSNATFTLCAGHGKAGSRRLVLSNHGELRAVPLPRSDLSACR